MRVGVILAARGPAPYLAEAVASVGGADEIVLVDHASDPPLPGLPGLPGVRMVRVDDPSGGPARARQAGLEALPDVDLIALLDADDVWQPGKLAAQLEAIGEAPVCVGRAEVIDARGRPTGERLPELEPGLHAAAPMARALYERNAIPAASVLMRREALVAVGGFEPGAELPAASDWDLWLRLAAAGCDFVCEPRARIRYRRHAGGLTSSVSRLAEAGLAIHERHAGLVDEATAQRAKAADMVTLARGRIRERRYADARKALAEAAELRPPTAHERLLKLATRLPIAREALGRRSPYRRKGV